MLTSSTSYARCNVPFSWHKMKSMWRLMAVKRVSNASLNRAVCKCQGLHFCRPGPGTLVRQHRQREAVSISVDGSRDYRWSQ